MKSLYNRSILPSAMILLSAKGDVLFCHGSTHSSNNRRPTIPASQDSAFPSTNNDRMDSALDSNPDDIASHTTNHLQYLLDRSLAFPISARRILTRQQDQQQQQQQQPPQTSTRLDFRDILQCTGTASPQSQYYNGDEDIYEESSSEYVTDYDDDGDSLLYESNDTSEVLLGEHSRGKLEGDRKLSHSPVVYQYYGRSRARGNPADSVHFILLGPNVDHWKLIGQILASKGFNAMACERLEKDGTYNDDGTTDLSNDAPNLVLEVLQVLRWNRVVLVGCDRESILAMETAMLLAPERVAGLVLCGELTEADRLASESGYDVLDSFLRRVLGCPFVIVWDGDSATLVSGSNAHRAVETHSSSNNNNNERCLILGGGSAPHRTKPEQFAWILTRFVEEKLETSNRSRTSTRIGEWNERAKERSSNLLRTLNVPFGIDSLVSPEGRLLLGRAAAAALFYIAMMKVVVVQYGMLRAGVLGIKSQFDSVATFRRKTFQAIASFFLNYGYIPRLFKIKNADDDNKKRREKTAETATPPTSSPPETPEQQHNSDTVYAPTTNEDEDDGNSLTEKLEEDEDENTDTDELEEFDEEQMIPKTKPFFFLDHIIT
eukprot:scaffold1481_cov137-Cylindrotheca_fusiformis.AAC.10